MDVGRMIVSVLAAAGEGIARLEDGGLAVIVRDCSIEVVVDEASEPSAQVRLTLAAAERGAAAQ